MINRRDLLRGLLGILALPIIPALVEDTPPVRVPLDIDKCTWWRVSYVYAPYIPLYTYRSDGSSQTICEGAVVNPPASNEGSYKIAWDKSGVFVLEG